MWLVNLRKRMDKAAKSISGMWVLLKSEDTTPCTSPLKLLNFGAVVNFCQHLICCLVEVLTWNDYSLIFNEMGTEKLCIRKPKICFVNNWWSRGRALCYSAELYCFLWSGLRPSFLIRKHKGKRVIILRYQPGLKKANFRNFWFRDVQIKLFKSFHLKKIPQKMFF